VAIKVLDGAAVPAEKEEFRREFEVLVSLQTPYAVYFYGACVKEKLCLVMEYCSRGSLYDVLNDKTLEFGWDKAFKFALEILNAVLSLHSQKPQVLHRDLKSRNLLVTSEWDIKLCDFGLSRFNTESSVSTLNKCRGTFVYIAPEVYECTGYTTKSDVYSLALILWEIFTRVVRGSYQRPFGEYTKFPLDMQVLLQACMFKLRPTFPPNTPQKLVLLMQNSWVHEVDKRPECVQLLAVLTKVQQEEYLKEKTKWNVILPKPSVGKDEKAEEGQTVNLTNATSFRPTLNRSSASSMLTSH